LDLLSDILVIGWLLDLSASALDLPLLALLASGLGVFFTGKIVRRWLDADQARMDAGEAELQLSQL
jgi:hypothetical protein